MVVSVASQKGGTGKTSTSISLAAGLAHKGKHVLLIDIDSQANSSKVLLHDYPKVTKEQTIYATILTRSPLVIHQTHVPNLSLVPSHILLSNTDIELTTAKDHRGSPFLGTFLPIGLALGGEEPRVLSLLLSR